MNRSVAIASFLLVGVSLAPIGSHVAADEQPLFGYSTESSRTERQWEEKLRAIPSPDNLRAYMQKLSAHPHHVGSQADKANAEWIASKFKEFVSIRTSNSLTSSSHAQRTPRRTCRRRPEVCRKLEEPALSQDPTSDQKSEQLPSYNAYSIDGDVTAPLVYVNYGIPRLRKLDRMGISVKGKIVIARYYHSWRGIKPKVAAEHGALGCLIYSDPHEDGLSGENFPCRTLSPAGWSPASSVADMPFYPGDPLTPGWVPPKMPSA